MQGQSGSDLEKRLKKLPLMSLCTAMVESMNELDPDSIIRRTLELTYCTESKLARDLASYELSLEKDVVQPLQKLSEEDLPVILKRKKQLQKLITDFNIAKSRYNQALRSSSTGVSIGTVAATGGASKLETLKEEEEDLKRKLEQCKDEYLADLYHFATKEEDYAKYFVHLLDIQADYHRKSLNSLDRVLTELKESHGLTDSLMKDVSLSGVYGVDLETHLERFNLEIALPIEACVMMLLTKGMNEEGLFRLAAGASILRKLKSSLAGGSGAMEEFYTEPHAVAGALKSYLRELPQPLMTFELYDDWMKAASVKEPEGRLESFKTAFNKLPEKNQSNLRYLIKFLSKLAENQEVNKMTPGNIAIVLGPNLLWPRMDKESSELDMASVSSILVVGVVEGLIQCSDELFPGDFNFNVSGTFAPTSSGTPPRRYSSDTTVEEAGTPAPTIMTPVMPARDTPPPTGEGKDLPASIPAPVQKPAPKPPTENTSPPLSHLAERMVAGLGPVDQNESTSTLRRVKKPAPARPSVPPPIQPRVPPSTATSTDVPESPSAPKAIPRRGNSVRAPGGPPPPVPPQPVKRQSRTSLVVPVDSKSGEPEDKTNAEEAQPTDGTDEVSPDAAAQKTGAPPVPLPRARVVSTDN
ncbi:SH3 domain-binding protein 1 isoform X2 [Ambystoma mexicanum]